MKQYVDELPNNCSDCPCYDYEYSCCNAIDIDLCVTDNFNRYEQRHKDCPLQSLADYTKQVRKEVCEEIKEVLYMTKENTCPNTANVVYYDVLKNILDQIQGETK